jgi:hypothetical protein
LDKNINPLDKNIKPIDKNICKKYIKWGAGLRFILTLITFYCMSKNVNSSYLLLMLPIVLTILDLTDNIFSFSYSWSLGYRFKDVCTRFFEYQITDKINDWTSYLIAWYVFKLDPVFLKFLIWRGIGVISFGLTRSSIPLVPMMDMMKEYLVFKYFSPNNNKLLPLVVVGKMIFEFFLHTVIRQRLY